MSIENSRSATAATDAETKIRDAVEADLPAIIDIYNAAIATRVATAQLEPVTIESRRHWLSEHSPDRYPFRVAEIHGRVAGWLSCKAFLPRCAYRGTIELSVYVDETFRRRGIATKLVEDVLARAPSLRIKAMVGLIFAHNESSLRLFGRLGFARWGLLPGVARVDGVQRDLVVLGRHCDGGDDATTGRWKSPAINKGAQFNDSLELMHALMQYRHQPIHGQLDKIRKKYSMLHLDVLLLIYHFAKTCSGQILEIGAFLGGGTIAAARGVRDSGKRKALITVEQGGSLEHKRLGTRNILRDLERNLAKQRISEMVTLIKGRSFEPGTVAAVRQALGPDEIGLLILDADAGKLREISCYSDKLALGCWMVIDDYYGVDPDSKIAATRTEVEALVAAGCLEPVGFYGWSTWVGRWRPNGYSSGEHRIARLDDSEGDLTIMRHRHGARPNITSPDSRPPSITSERGTQLNECLQLMEILLDYRRQPIHAEIQKVRHKKSMLHLDVLVLIYHFAKTSPGHILEIGAFIGGATIAAALGVRDSGKQKVLLSIEPGGSIEHESLGTRNILRDLERNLAKARVAEMVTLIQDYSFAPAAISAVQSALGSDTIGLLIIDADGNVQRDINAYADALADGCWMIIDDYTGPSAKPKMVQTRAEVDALTAAGTLEALGVYGWGTWVGRWRGPTLPVRQSPDEPRR